MEEIYDPNTIYYRHPKSHRLGGIHLKDQAAKVTEIGLNVLKTLGVKIVEGGVFDLLTISRPAVVSYHKTYHECMSREYINTKYLKKAAETTNIVDRMKYVVLFLMSGIWRNPAEMQNNGPLNPILGETYTAEKADGTTIYCEQICHHPPVTAYLIVGPNNSYRLYGTGQLDVKMNGFNNIIGTRSGKTTVEFADGTKIMFTNPDTRIDGLLMGDRRYNYMRSCVFLDKTHHISAEVNFLYNSVGAISKLSNGIKRLFGSHSETPQSDRFEVIFFHYVKENGESKKQVICEGSGSWVSHIQIANKLLWEVDDAIDDPWIERMDKRLPSDSLFREDSKFIKLKDFDKAQKAKDALENRQRNDAKLRKEYASKK